MLYIFKIYSAIIISIMFFSCLARILAPYLGCAQTWTRMSRKKWSLGHHSSDLAQISFLESHIPFYPRFQGIYSTISRFLEIVIQSHPKISQNRKKRKFITWKPSFFGSALIERSHLVTLFWKIHIVLSQIYFVSFCGMNHQ